MYAQVVVLTYQSPDIDSYTYEIPPNLESKIQLGQFVSVPFGKRNPMGIIISCHPERSEGSVVIDSSSSTQNDKWGKTENDKKIQIKPLTSIILEEPILLTYQIELLKWMAAYYMAPMINCLDAILPQIPKRLNNQPSTINNQQSFQTLVLVPNIDKIPETLAGFPQAKNYAIYHSELAMVPKFQMWQKIMSGNCDFIFGSRLAIFAPCPNLKKIIIYDEHDGAYKDERSPYFDTLTVAEKIAELTKSKIEIIDSSPRITTFTNHKNDITFPVIAIRQSAEKQSQKQIAAGSSSPRNDEGVMTKTIDMTIEKAYGSYSPISETLEEILRRAADKKLSTLLFLNKKSESGSVYCKSCKTQSPVPKQVAICPNCQSADIYFNSININSLSRQIQHLSSTIQNLIDIETAAAFYKLLPKKYDIAVHIKTDSVLNIPDYTSAEKLYAQITNLKKLTKKLVVLQTYDPDHFVIKSAINSNYQHFYLEEIRQRKTFSYPPYSLLIKIVVSGTEQKAQEIFDTINSQLSPLGPFKGEGNSKYNIILKIKLADYSLATKTKAVDKIHSLLPRQKDIRVVVEPASLL